MKHEYKLGEVVKVLVNGKYNLQGEIVDIKDNNATVVVPMYYSNSVEYIPVESKIEDLKEIVKDINYYKDKPGYMDLRLWD